MSIQHTLLFATTYSVFFLSIVTFLCIGVEQSLARSQFTLVLCGLTFICMVVSLFTP